MSYRYEKRGVNSIGNSNNSNIFVRKLITKDLE